MDRSCLKLIVAFLHQLPIEFRYVTVLIELQPEYKLKLEDQIMSDTILDATVQKGLDLLDQGEVKQAISVLEGYWAGNRSQPESWFYLGDALAEDGRLDDAIARYREGLKLSPEDADALTTLGDMLLEAGNHKESLACYKKVLDIDPKDADALVSIGLVYGSQDRTDDAIRAFRQALELEPENVFALNALGDALYGQGDVEGAIAAFTKGVEIDPEDPAAHFNLGELYYDLEELEEAEDACLEAVKRDPGFSMAYLTLGGICMDQDRTADAIAYFENYLKYEKSVQAVDMIAEVKAVVEGLKEEMKG